ncbi:hypothetical protein JTE90_021142 [Oedothorax gibbosus]|uniref:DNA-directed DNA polymerase n=1 Tax=Oedothorax gibbosus TaxID=931172 RepID=A0AAV6U1A2_9ARAC|nr:hypothetical protein JTE90_021142 [Oedothorax gibbosus]
MKGFDGQFILRWLLERGHEPSVIPQGSKLMCVDFSPLSIKLIDSFNFLPMALSQFPKTFGITELAKGYFPHLFNTAENQDYIGPLPDASYYSPDTMSVTARENFFAWYEERKKDPFDFQKEMLMYCRSDVDILRRCCLEFRKQFMDTAQVDPFRYITIAAACMACFRSQHIPANLIAMMPSNGYINTTNFSRDSIRWLEWVAHQESITICHALNGAGEVKVGGISVDGFCQSTRTIYQFHGCFFHGCLQCFNPDVVNPVTSYTMKLLNDKIRENTEKLQRQWFTVVEMWEHDFKAEKKNNADLKSFLSTLEICDRLNPRDAFFGGRTNAVKLYHEGPSKYIDFTSLYPYCNKYSRYPVGHSEVLIPAVGETDIEGYFGIVKCRVLPPKGLLHPVLPYRCKDKLMFPLCRTCSETLQQTPCNHTPEQRSLTGTWVSEELKVAVEKGYVILKQEALVIKMEVQIQQASLDTKPHLKTKTVSAPDAASLKDAGDNESVLAKKINDSHLQMLQKVQIIQRLKSKLDMKVDENKLTEKAILNLRELIDQKDERLKELAFEKYQLKIKLIYGDVEKEHDAQLFETHKK